MTNEIHNLSPDFQILNEWLYLEWSRGVGWTILLPTCPKCIPIDADGNAGNPDPSIWDGPSEGWILAYFHPGAKWELRTVAGAPGSPHGNQCTYDSSGRLLTTPPAAGSADYFGPNNDFLAHQANDVSTFKLAKKLAKIPSYYSVRPVH